MQTYIIKNEIKQLITKFGEEVVKQILLGDFEIIEHSEYLVIIKIDDEPICIWMANDWDSTNFYRNMGSDYDETFSTILCRFFEIPVEKREEVRKIIKVKQGEFDKKEGLKRSIEQTQMSNDLFFKFNGVYNIVKFTGYNDNDWWTKYKPLEVKEDDNIIWQIDYENMVAIYKESK